MKQIMTSLRIVLLVGAFSIVQSVSAMLPERSVRRLCLSVEFEANNRTLRRKRQQQYDEGKRQFDELRKEQIRLAEATRAILSAAKAQLSQLEQNPFMQDIAARDMRAVDPEGIFCLFGGEEHCSRDTLVRKAFQRQKEIFENNADQMCELTLQLCVMSDVLEGSRPVS